jgi:hypothetical protein
MSVRPCPACGEPTPRHLHETSRDAKVNYYRCANPKCGHIWAVNKIDPSKVRHITPLPNGKRKRNS